MENIRDAHYFALPSQGNVYSLTKLCMLNGVNKILAASLRRKVFSFEFSKDTNGFLKPTVKEVLFTYIPSGTEIISVDAFTKSQSSDDFVIGITFLKSSSDHNSEIYFNIYSEWEPSTEFNLDSVAQNCLMLELDFVPYQLYHTELLVKPQDEAAKEVVWLLSGSDKKVHMFREDRANHCYSQVELAEYFPELVQPPDIILWMDIYHCKDGLRRITSYGCECGFVKLVVVNLMKREVISSWSAQFDGPVSSVRLFTEQSELQPPSFLNIPPKKKRELPVHLLVSNTLQPSIIYMNVLEDGLRDKYLLPGSDRSDAVLCSAIADVDMDGNHEVLLGTYGQEVLVYKLEAGIGTKPWKLMHRRSFANPIHSIMYMDVTGDGVKEVIIQTLRGVHIMQHDSKDVENMFRKQYEELKTAEVDTSLDIPDT